MMSEQNKQVQHWADSFMFSAEEIDRDKGPEVFLLNCNHDPLGSIAAAAMAYVGKFVTDLAEVTDEDRMYYFREARKTALAMPLESVQFHFRIKGVTRGFTHQMVRQRIGAAYCLSGDTRVYSEDRNKRYTLEELYQKWNGPDQRIMGSLSQLKIRTCDDQGNIVRRTIKNVFQSGEKEVFEVTTANGYSIKTSKDHLFYRPDGSYTRLEEMSEGDEVTVNGIEAVRDRGCYPEKTFASKIVSIKSVGTEMTYDLEMNGEYHRFVANGFLVHNSQESSRFAVKERVPVGLPPSLTGTLSRQEWFEQQLDGSEVITPPEHDSPEADEWIEKWASQQQRWRFKWDEACDHIEETYNTLVNDGMPAEDARGLLPTNLLTQINYFTSLRGLQDHAGMRLCTQAQFEWRVVWAQILQSIRQYGKTAEYAVFEKGGQGQDVRRVKSAAWQFDALATIFKPVCYYRGSCPFKADFDRKCSIRERVNAYEAHGVKSTEWEEGRADLGIPAIHPAEWLLDPAAAR